METAVSLPARSNSKSYDNAVVSGQSLRADHVEYKSLLLLEW